MSPIDRLLQVARWRWTPLVVPTFGTSAFVLILAWLVPTDIGKVGHHSPRASSFGMESHSSSDSSHDGDDATAPPPQLSTHVSALPTSHAPGRRRGFSPPLERPNEPPPPPPPVAPPPTATEMAPTPPPPPPPVSEGPNSDRWRDGQQAASSAATLAGARAGARAGSLSPRVFNRNHGPFDAPPAEPPPSDAPPQPEPASTDQAQEVAPPAQ